MERMPCCGRRLKSHQAFSHPGTVPEAGSLTVCAGCGAVLVFDEAVRLRLPREGELAKLSAEEAADVSAAMRKVQRERLQ